MVETTEIERVYREQGARMWRAVVLYAGDRDVASDAVAEAFAQALGHGDSIRDPAKWVWRAAFHIALDELRRRRRSVELVEDRYELPESMTDLLRALGGLSHNQRASVILHDYAGYSRSEIATLLGSSSSAVGVHLFRARRRLRDALEVRDA